MRHFDPRGETPPRRPTFLVHIDIIDVFCLGTVLLGLLGTVAFFVLDGDSYPLWASLLVGHIAVKSYPFRYREIGPAEFYAP